MEVRALGLSRLFSFNAIRVAWKLAGWLRRERIDIVQTFFRDANIFEIFIA